MKPTPESPHELPEALLLQSSVPSGVPENVRNDQAEKVRQLMGQDVMTAPLQKEEPLVIPLHPVAAERQPDMQETALRDAERVLDDMQDLAQELVSKNQEHRVRDFRDNLPIFANIRSHTLATREGMVISRLKQMSAQLQALVYTKGLPLDLQGLQDAVSRLHEPHGWSKWTATILAPGLRTFHRSVTVQRPERVKDAIADLKQQVRGSRPEFRQAA